MVPGTFFNLSLGSKYYEPDIVRSHETMAVIEKQQNRARMNFSWQLLPSSSAKIFPDYVPKAIIDDYEIKICLLLKHLVIIAKYTKYPKIRI